MQIMMILGVVFMMAIIDVDFINFKIMLHGTLHFLRFSFSFVENAGVSYYYSIL